LADRGWRRRLVLGGGITFGVALLALSLAPSFLVLLAASALLYPASGAFVTLSQATLMDDAPGERERNMARWTLVGSAGAAGGPLLLAAGLPWRAIFAGYAVAALVLVAALWRRRLDNEAEGGDLAGALRALRDRTALRWVALLELQDLTGDVLFSYLALYMVDVAGTDPRTAALGVLAWTGGSLVGNVFVLHVLKRVEGLRWLRATALVVALLLPAFQLAPGVVTKVVLLAAIAFLGAGWYPISQAKLYAALPGRGGTVMAVSSAAGAVGAVLPLAVGLVAAQVGLYAAFWLLLLGPVALLLGVPRPQRGEQ
jgi:FSR family fosmidomycin resistance protein-like MFS transporter